MNITPPHTCILKNLHIGVPAHLLGSCSQKAACALLVRIANSSPNSHLWVESKDMATPGMLNPMRMCRTWLCVWSATWTLSLGRCLQKLWNYAEFFLLYGSSTETEKNSYAQLREKPRWLLKSGTVALELKDWAVCNTRILAFSRAWSHWSFASFSEKHPLRMPWEQAVV